MKTYVGYPIGLTILALAASAGCNTRVQAGPRADEVRALEVRKSLVGSTPADTPGDAGGAMAEATGWATLSGSFKVAGTAPPMAKIAATKDPEVCGKHELVEESVVVGPGGELLNAVIFLRTAKAPVHPDLIAPAGEVVLDNHNCRFEPHVVAVRTGQTLSIINSDPVSHNSKLDPNTNPGANQTIPAREGDKAPSSFKVTYAKEEAIPFKVGCSIHPWMGGWVVVRSDPYAAVSDKSGSFTIANLPAGVELEFQLWQENAQGLKSATAEGLKIDAKGRFKIKLDAGEARQISFTVPAGAFKVK